MLIRAFSHEHSRILYGPESRTVQDYKTIEDGLGLRVNAHLLYRHTRALMVSFVTRGIKSPGQTNNANNTIQLYSDFTPISTRSSLPTAVTITHLIKSSASMTFPITEQSKLDLKMIRTVSIENNH